MKKVTLANINGETKEVKVDLSLGYLFFGPLYHLYKLMIVRGLVLLLIYVAIIYKGFFPLVKDVLVGWNVDESSLGFLDSLAGMYWWLLGILLVVHILLTIITPRMVINKLFKKGYVPYAELDTQILIKHNLVKVGTLCYLSSFKAVDGVQGKIKMGNSKNLDKELEELKQLLKDGMITKDEYETKRAMAIMRSGNKKK